MRNAALHAVLESFTADAAARLASATAAGAEIPFELVAEPGGSTPLYCYRPLTGRFITERLRPLSGLTSYAPAARTLSELDGIEAYLRARGQSRVPAAPRERADAGLLAFLSRVFDERSRFRFEPERFEAAYAELELALYEGRRTTTVLVPVHGVALDAGTAELALGDGLALVRGDAWPEVPPQLIGEDGRVPGVLVVLMATADASTRALLVEARRRVGRLLTALRLFDQGRYALGPLGFERTDGGPWQPVTMGSGGRSGRITFISMAHEDELRAFHNLLARRQPAAGEVAWALRRFEMGCERSVPLEALSDFLLALRALLEPEGPVSGRLAGRLAAVCGQPDERLALTERVAGAVVLERTVIAGLQPTVPDPETLVDELAEHLRAILRDVLCGHLDEDVPAVADELLAEATTVSGAGR